MQPNQLALKTAFLVAFDSPKQAFYVLWIEAGGESFRVCKVSGAKGRIWHRQAWDFDSLSAAEALFEKRLREKTRPDRRSNRKYELQFCQLELDLVYYQKIYEIGKRFGHPPGLPQPALRLRSFRGRFHKKLYGITRPLLQ